MTKLEFEVFISSSKAERQDMLNKLVSPTFNPRQSKIEINKDYYNGIHWDFDANKTANTTRSGKKVWGKMISDQGISDGTDVYGRDKVKSFDPSFHEGQLQKRNYIKQFIQVYQDYIFGDSHEPFKIMTDDSMSSEILETFWFTNSDIFSLTKDILAKGVLSTIYPLMLKYSDKLADYRAESFDAMDLFPIYSGTETIGFIEAYMIDGVTAKAMYGVQTKKDAKAVFARIYIVDNGVYYTSLTVDGEILSKQEDGTYKQTAYEESLTKLDNELAFLPYYMQPNIDNATAKFDDRTLEDSEIFGWIDKNDALNANETMAFLGTILFVFPTKQIDFERAERIGISPNSPEFKQAMIRWQPSMFELNNMPVVTEPGQPIDGSFYDQLDRIKSSLFEEAGIPEFLVSGKGLSQVSEKTVRLALAGLVKKIEQKRSGLTELFKKVSVDYLALKGITIAKADVIVEWPDIIGDSKTEIVEMLYGAVDRGILPQDYVRRKVLEITNNEEDIAEVKTLAQDSLLSLRKSVDERVATVRNERDAEKELIREEKNKSELANIESRIKTLNGAN